MSEQNISSILQEENIDLNKEKFLKEMVEAKLCFGKSASRLHPKMKPYIVGIKNSQTIIDLEKTYEMLKKAKDFFQLLINNQKTILFVNTNPATNDITYEAAKKTNNPYVINRWVGGLLTNFSIISKRINYYNDLIQKNATGELEKYTKKEQLKFKKELEDLEILFGGVKDFNKLPDAIFVVGGHIHQIAIKEAKKTNVPVIAIVNTDDDLTNINYPIVASDLYRSSVEYITNFLIN
ncbi:MAG TPA: 30S ribosomal protein S2 [Candidatus Paceibacterota bacterium]|nr:30S ribosomal protein S2 [Parcubacteria group bacterium]HOM33197.1 30S ribosomal protein S2 [Candidatus Paceibacterota bacterium]HPC37256.1 30S ribosomal protein S2 [Candidatus Paceibacterota bacterium]HRU35713.1 30S ribosomal protein S2 [Candidatus Paceibacterota bacterium]